MSHRKDVADIGSTFPKKWGSQSSQSRLERMGTQPLAIAGIIVHSRNEKAGDALITITVSQVSAT
jgi:hypothetical protein